jgi:hypothetical protein
MLFLILSVSLIALMSVGGVIINAKELEKLR